MYPSLRPARVCQRRVLGLDEPVHRYLLGDGERDPADLSPLPTPALVRRVRSVQRSVSRRAGLTSVAGGVIADRRGRYKEVAGAGYGTAAACKLGLLAARNAPWPASTVLFADRVGKGVRSAPRDALISLSADQTR